jgi:hypothetical protein
MYAGPAPGQREVMSNIESLPSTWDDVRDVQFFRIVSHVLEARVVEGASSLLAANDPELAPFA